MKRTVLGILALAITAAQANAETATPTQFVITEKPDVKAIQQSPERTLQIDKALLLSLLQPPDPDPAMNAPDKGAWQLFVQVNAPAATAGNNNVLFETWASDQDTFTQNPVWPTTPTGSKILVTPALSQFAPRVRGLRPHMTPGGSEETRRNQDAFEFIKITKLFTKAGLRAAFAAKKVVSFPIDAIEVKANWVPASTVDASKYHVNTASDGKQYALVSLHIISKQIPNWTWATFEHQDNKGRCDFIGCHDAFGATQADVPAKTPVGGTYPACTKTAGLQKMMTGGKLEAAFANYCLKGSQVDFTTATGLPTRLGNSVPEAGFVLTSSCITCHSRASTDATGGSPQGAGFVNPPIASLCPVPNNNCAPSGTPNPAWFWNNPGKPNQSIKTLVMDFVWAIPLRAIGP